jgi:hypothetical protein
LQRKQPWRLTAAYPFLAKPVDLDALLQCINRFARERG